ncbi:MAG: inositol monophosphatase [Acidimicrobiia bacterium]|nr:inositol monophosphatase [Acidimicrobiia bacterium]
MSPAADPDELLDVAREAAAAAAAVLLSRFRKPATGVTTKSSRTDPVSDADRLAEAAIGEVLRHRRPGDTVLGEESGETQQGTGSVRWVVDPLDGTVNYLYGQPMWAVSIAAEMAGAVVAGVVAQPCTGEVFAARRGGGASLDGETLTVSASRELSTSLVATGFAYLPEIRARQAAVLTGLLPRVRDVRRGGSAALDLAHVAAGRLDVYYETGLAIWDVAAGRLLVTEAGGTSTALASGASPAPARERDVGLVAGPPALVEALAELLSEIGT